MSLVGAGRWIAAGSLDGGVEGVVITADFLLGGVLFARLGMSLRAPSSLSLDARST